MTANMTMFRGNITVLFQGNPIADGARSRHEDCNRVLEHGEDGISIH